MTAMPKVGAYAGWHIEFREVIPRFGCQHPRISSMTVLRRSARPDYYASIDATLPGTLDGGSYTFVIEGMTSEDYAKLYQGAQTRPGGAPAPLLA